MQFLSSAAARKWTEERGYEINDSFGHPVPQYTQADVRFKIPLDAGARVALARMLWESITEGSPEVLLWITDYGVWPSGEHRPLAESARRGLGARSALQDTPGHLIHLGEDDGGLTIVCLAILFLWDCWILPSAGSKAAYLSHDEYGIVYGRRGDEAFLRRLDAFKVERIEA